MLVSLRCGLLFWLLFATCLLGEEGPSVDRDEGTTSLKRPNILFLFADDQRPDTIGAWGNERIQTPSIDSLAHRGISFRNNYCLGSNSGAVCVPSRAMVMSGRSYFKINNQLKGVSLMPELLGHAGYETFATGKWHNGAESILRGFQRGEAVYLNGMGDHTKLNVVDLVDGEAVNPRVGKKFSSELFADATIKFLQTRDKSKPFFAYTAFTSPHDPRQPPPRYREMYYQKKLPPPVNFMPQHPFNNGTLVLRDENLAAWPRQWDVIQDQLAEYYGLVTHMDDQVGRVLKELETQGVLENTIVVFAADHGLAMGSHGLLGKQSVYEHSMGCPLIIAGPGIDTPQTSQAFTYLIDIMPTVLRAAGVDLPKNLDGHSLWPVIHGEKDQVRDDVFLSYTGQMRSIRNGDHKMIFYPKFNHIQLFNLTEDPHEMNDLADQKAKYGKLMVELEERLKRAQAQFGDQLPLQVENPKSKEIDLTGTPRKPDRWQPDWIVKKYFDPQPKNDDKQ